MESFIGSKWNSSAWICKSGIATAGSDGRQAFIAFKAPEKNGGSPITSYTVTINSEVTFGETFETAEANTLEVDKSGNLKIEVKDLSSGSYTFGGTATNENGSRAMSTALNEVIIL